MVRFLYSWAEELTSIKWCDEELSMSQSATVYWNAYIREAIVEQQKIGGQSTIVKIDESIFTKRKDNTGRVFPQQMISG